jgi:hypothetical protein
MLTGVTALAACACGAGSGIVKALASGGIHTHDTVILGASCGTDHSVQPIFIGVGALLILFGMSLRSLSSAVIAAIGCAGIAIGHFLAGPSTMSIGLLPHKDTHLWGYAGYLIGAAFLIAAFLRVFRSPKPLAAGTAMGGMAMATGCNCCMVTGSISALIASAGMPWIYNQSFVYLAGIAIVAAALWKLGGYKPAVLAAAGGLINYGGPKLIAKAPDIVINGASYRFIPGYVAYFAGAALLMTSFVIAYKLAERRYGARDAAPLVAEPAVATTT